MDNSERKKKKERRRNTFDKFCDLFIYQPSNRKY